MLSHIVMVATTTILEQAYLQAETGNYQYAKALLESLVSIQPLNIEAWEAYLQLCRSCDELDYLCERVLQIDGIRSTDLESILDYYYFLRQNLKMRQAEQDHGNMITFELVEQFTYTLKDNSLSADISVWDYDVLANLGGKWFGILTIAGYFVLLFVGLKLQANGNSFGYWILLALTIGIFINLWNVLFPGTAEKVTTEPP